MNIYASKPIWHQGAIVLMDSKVLAGEIAIEPDHDLILFRTKGSLTIYTSHKLKSFRYYDASVNVNRKFISLEDNYAVVRNHHFYEVVVAGKVNVLRRHKGVIFKNDNPDRYDFNYFFYNNNEIKTLMRFRTSLYPEMLQTHHDQVLMFVDENDLNPNLEADAIKIIEFYNRQKDINTFAGI